MIDEPEVIDVLVASFVFISLCVVYSRPNGRSNPCPVMEGFPA